MTVWIVTASRAAYGSYDASYTDVISVHSSRAAADQARADYHAAMCRSSSLDYESSDVVGPFQVNH